MGLSRTWATKYGILEVRTRDRPKNQLFTVRNGVLTSKIPYFVSPDGVDNPIWATKYGIFEVRNGSVTCTELQKPTCHGEKWGCHGAVLHIIDPFLTVRNGVCHGSGLQNMVFFTVRNGSVTVQQLQKPTFSR